MIGTLEPSAYIEETQNHRGRYFILIIIMDERRVISTILIDYKSFVNHKTCIIPYHYFNFSSTLGFLLIFNGSVCRSSLHKNCLLW